MELIVFDRIKHISSQSQKKAYVQMRLSITITLAIHLNSFGIELHSCVYL